MSLVGSLEDLGLGDILQIISLSRKSGVLLLRSEHGEGQILFDQGLIRCAFVKGGPTALRELLAQRDVVEAEALEAAWQDAHARGVDLAEVLQDRALLAADVLDALRRENIESAVLRMFGWPTGEFSFEVRDVAGDEGEELFVLPGINPQFLALEGTRRADEGAGEGDGGAEDAEEVAEPVFAGEDAAGADEEPAAAAPAEPLELASALEADAGADAPVVEGHLVEEPEAAALAPEPAPAVHVSDDAAVHASDAPVVAGEPAEDEDGREEVEAVAAEPAPSADTEDAVEAVLDEPADGARAGAGAVAAEAAPAGRVTADGPTPPLVVIDPDLVMLEWLKETLSEHYGLVHIFQRTDLGVERIRQYLARARMPAVLLAADAPADPVTGGRSPLETVARLKRQSARMPVVLLVPDGEEPPQPGRGGAAPDGVVAKPSATHLADERCVRERADVAARLREVVAASVASTRPRGAARPSGDDAVARLKAVSARIRDRASNGEVLPQVIAFAAQSFRRVALFMVREDEALGLAQVGLPEAGGPDAAGLRELRVPCREPGWFREVLESRHPFRGPPRDEGDRRLAARLGSEEPEEAYVAPLESGGQVVALLYADNLPGREPLGDSGTLEVVLHEAGMALDRAVLERALEEAEAP